MRFIYEVKWAKVRSEKIKYYIHACDLLIQSNHKMQTKIDQCGTAQAKQYARNVKELIKAIISRIPKPGMRKSFPYNAAIYPSKTATLFQFYTRYRRLKFNPSYMHIRLHNIRHTLYIPIVDTREYPFYLTYWSAEHTSLPYVYARVRGATSARLCLYYIYTRPPQRPRGASTTYVHLKFANRIKSFHN